MAALMDYSEYIEAQRLLRELTAPPDKAFTAYMSDDFIAKCPKALSFLCGWTRVIKKIESGRRLKK